MLIRHVTADNNWYTLSLILLIIHHYFCFYCNKYSYGNNIGFITNYTNLFDNKNNDDPFHVNRFCYYTVSNPVPGPSAAIINIDTYSTDCYFCYRSYGMRSFVVDVFDREGFAFASATSFCPSLFLSSRSLQIQILFSKLWLLFAYIGWFYWW